MIGVDEKKVDGLGPGPYGLERQLVDPVHGRAASLFDNASCHHLSRGDGVARGQRVHEREGPTGIHRSSEDPRGNAFSDADLHDVRPTSDMTGQGLPLRGRMLPRRLAHAQHGAEGPILERYSSRHLNTSSNRARDDTLQRRPPSGEGGHLGFLGAAGSQEASGSSPLGPAG